MQICVHVALAVQALVRQSRPRHCAARPAAHAGKPVVMDGSRGRPRACRAQVHGAAAGYRPAWPRVSRLHRRHRSRQRRSISGLGGCDPGECQWWWYVSDVSPSHTSRPCMPPQWYLGDIVASIMAVVKRKTVQWPLAVALLLFTAFHAAFVAGMFNSNLHAPSTPWQWTVVVLASIMHVFLNFILSLFACCACVSRHAACAS